jgi:hypothetical protein
MEATSRAGRKSTVKGAKYRKTIQPPGDQEKIDRDCPGRFLKKRF